MIQNQFDSRRQAVKPPTVEIITSGVINDDLHFTKTKYFEHLRGRITSQLRKRASEDHITDLSLQPTVDEILVEMTGAVNKIVGLLFGKVKCTVTSDYGSRRVNHPEASSNHKGIDIAPVGARDDLPWVEFVGVQYRKSSTYGNVIENFKVKGEKGVYTFGLLLAHLERKVVNGHTYSYRVGSSGVSTGTHLHLEVTYVGQE